MDDAGHAVIDRRDPVAALEVCRDRVADVLADLLLGGVIAVEHARIQAAPQNELAVLVVQALLQRRDVIRRKDALPAVDAHLEHVIQKRRTE